MRSIDIITMGCSKNLVDSEQLMRQFEAIGFTCYHNPDKHHGDVVVVNTCGFIGDAKEESINLILSLSQDKTQGLLHHLYVMGCLSERYLQELTTEIPEVDKFYGKFDWRALISDLGFTPKARAHERVLTTPAHYAYIKISEGCDRCCAYCAIPIITGHHVSRPMEEIVEEVQSLVARGVKEFQIIAQELTYYGVDLYHEQRIAALVEAIADIPGVAWIRLHYAYPTHFPHDLLRVMRERDNVCAYLDIALQHISDNMLQRMQRHITKAETLQLIEDMRREVPGICIRTTLMVGFPGETDADFHELLDFVRQVRFDRMGAFAYSEEEGTYAAEHYTDDVPMAVKQQRLDTLMALQQDISEALLTERIGQRMRVIIDRKEGDWYVGRTAYDSPDVDCEVLIAADACRQPLTIGAFYDVHIDSTEEFDLYATVID